MAGDVVMEQAAAAMLDYDEHIQQTKGCGHCNEEIAGNDSLRV
jgi:hypothetical protein